MAVVLKDVELRVLGVLIEKSLTHPKSYPLTLNAILLGSNQKQNREPVLDLTEAEIASALYSLQQKELVDHAPTAPGARSNRFEHRVVDTLHWDRREQAVMAELMLRSRQTAGELRTRGSRMTPIPDMEAVNAIISGLMERDPPFVEELPREPGRSANRFRHLLTGGDARSAVPSAEPATPVRESSFADDGARIDAGARMDGGTRMDAGARILSRTVDGSGRTEKGFSVQQSEKGFSVQQLDSRSSGLSPAVGPAAVEAGSMAGDTTPDLAGRVGKLEQQVALLTRTIEELQKKVGPAVDRPDGSAV